MLLGYCRVSTNEQAGDDRTSLEVQQRVIHGLAMSKGLGKLDVHMYIDAGVSGSISLCKRPEGMKLFDDANKGDTIVAAKLDRLFRDALDAQYCYKNFQQRGVDLILYDMGVEPVTRDGMSKFFFTLLSAFADLERGRIKDRMMDGKFAKRAKGGYIGGLVPYGFKRIGTGRAAKLEVDEAEQKVIKFIHEYSYKEPFRIATMLTAHGYKTRRDTPFRVIQVQRILEKRNAAH